MKTTHRCDAIVVQLIVTQYDEHGRPVGEQSSSPTKVFRATVRDVWAEVDKAVAVMEKERASQAIASAAPTKAAKKR